MSSISNLCRSAVAELEGGVSCCVYVLNEDDPPDSVSTQRQALSGLFAGYTSRPEYEREVRAFAEIALVALGPPGQSRLALSGAEGLRNGEFFLASRFWGFARFLPGKQVLVVLLSHPSSNPNHGWAALNTATSRIGNAF